MLYKKFGGDNFASQVVGEAKLRQLKQVDAPYLSASGPGFAARKRGGTNEVWLDTPPPELPQSAIQYAVIGSHEYSFAGATFGTKFKKTKFWAGEYIGRGRTAASVPPQLRLWNRGFTFSPMYTSEKPGAVYFRGLYESGVGRGAYIQGDTRIISEAQYQWNVRQGCYDEPPIPEGGIAWEDSLSFYSTHASAFWSGRTAFVGWVKGWQAYATPNVVWDGSTDGNGQYRGKAVIDITIYRDAGDGDMFQHRVELEFPDGTPGANEVPGTITVLRPGVFVVLAGQSLRGPRSKDLTDAHIALWHNVIEVEEDQEDWFVSSRAYKLHEDENTVWDTTDSRYDRSKFIQSSARVASQSPGVLCGFERYDEKPPSDAPPPEGQSDESVQSILYAISSPWYQMLDEQIVTGSRDFAVAYVRVTVDGLIQSGSITTPEILKATTYEIPYEDKDGIGVKIYRDKAFGLMPACDLLYCGGGVIINRVREFVSQTTVTHERHGTQYSWPINNAPPLPKFNRVELWRSTDNGSTWAKMLTGSGLPSAMNVANIGIPTVVEAKSGGVPKLVIPVRDEVSGMVKISKSTDGGFSWSSPKGGFSSINVIHHFNGGHGVDLFSLRGGGCVNNTDQSYGTAYGTESLNMYDGDAPPIVVNREAFTSGSDTSKTNIVNGLYPAFDKALKEVVRVKIGSKDAPKDLVRPWIYDSAYEKPKEP